MPQQAITGNFTARVVQFCRFARSCGMDAGVKESIDALQALRISGNYNREDFRDVLRAVLCSSTTDWELFDEVFDRFWQDDNRRTSTSVPGSRRSSTQRTESEGSHGIALSIGQASSDPENHEGRGVLGATESERLKKMDFSQIPRNEDDLAGLEQLSWRLARQMALRISRRLKANAATEQVDVRRSIRCNISRGAELLELRFKGKKREQSRIVILLDVSGSMNAYSIFLLRFAYILHRYLRKVSTFAFSTRLEEITSALRSRRFSDVLQSLSAKDAGWSGGTRIGESLREFNRLHARKLLTRDTFFIVLSDGWDTGEPGLLAAELASIKLRARRLIWLNPLLGLDEYQPITRGMSAALPSIDVFAPAHNLESLLALESHLARR